MTGAVTVERSAVAGDRATGAASGGAPATALAAVYGAVAEWFLYPEEIDPGSLGEAVLVEVEEQARAIDPEVAAHLRAFCDTRETVDPEAYLNLLELNPRCPLYLGSYRFPEPTTCSQAGISERNQYMLEIGNVYRHFGFEIARDLPDFLPAMVEFLALTADSAGDDAELRLRVIDKLMLPGVEQFAEKLRAEGGPYDRLAQALVMCLRLEVTGDPREVRAPNGGVAGAAGSTARGGGLNLVQIAEASSGGGKP